jgi:hypothetical protein
MLERLTRLCLACLIAFVFAGLPGEPAFMHRPAAAESPEAPITRLPTAQRLLPSSQCWLSGVVTFRPSRSSRILI